MGLKVKYLQPTDKWNNPPEVLCLQRLIILKQKLLQKKKLKREKNREPYFFSDQFYKHNILQSQSKKQNVSAILNIFYFLISDTIHITRVALWISFSWLHETNIV